MGLKERKQVQSEIPFNIFGAKLRGGAPAKKKKIPALEITLAFIFSVLKLKKVPPK